MSGVRRGMCVLVLLVVAAVGAAAARSALSRSTPFEPRVPTLSALATSVIADPSPVLGTDGRRHLVYEIQVINTSPMRVRIDRLIVGDPGRRVVVDSFGAGVLGDVTVADGVRQPSRTFQPGRSGVIFL